LQTLDLITSTLGVPFKLLYKAVKKTAKEHRVDEISLSEVDFVKVESTTGS
jgi:hypothetical protein